MHVVAGYKNKQISNFQLLSVLYICAKKGNRNV